MVGAAEINVWGGGWCGEEVRLCPLRGVLIKGIHSRGRLCYIRSNNGIRGRRRGRARYMKKKQKKSTAGTTRRGTSIKRFLF